MTTGAVIVTYNPQIVELKNLLKSIVNSLLHVVIVDNGSRNYELIAQLKSDDSKINILPLHENKGIGFAQNRGIEYLLNIQEIEAIILFDHDSHPEPLMIENLASDYQQLKEKGIKVGAVGPSFIDPRTNNQYPIPLIKGFRLKKLYPAPGDNHPVECSFLIASGCFFPRSVIKECGLMNEGFFIDYIDIEWSFRLQHNGYKLFTCPSAKMDHQVGDERLQVLGREISVHSPLRRYYLARNSVLMIKTGYINWRYRTRELFYSFSRVLIYLFLVNHKLTYLRYILHGWYDGFCGKLGPADFIQNNKR